MAKMSKIEQERRKEKMKKIEKLKVYLEAQEAVLRNIYLEQEREVNCQPSDKVKRARKVYETVESFSFTMNPNEYTVSITWFDGFNGDVFVKNVDIDSQIFCFTFMLFLNTLTYRIMSALQDYSPNGWCHNEFWKTRLQLKISTFEIFGYYAEGADTV